MRCQAKAGDDVHHVAERDRAAGVDVRPFTQVDTLQPVLQRLALALISDFIGDELLLAQPLGHVLQRGGCLVLIDGLGLARAGGREVERRSEALDDAGDGRIAAGQLEKNLVGQVLFLELGRIKGLEEVDVEVAIGLRCWPVVGGAEEEVAAALYLVLNPFQPVLPNLVTGDVGGVGALHQLTHGAVVRAVELFVVEGGDLLVDLGVVVDVLFQVEVVLLCVGSLRNELTVDGLENFAQHGVNLRQQVVCRVAAHLFDAGVVQAQAVSQFGGHQADGDVGVAARGQPVDRQRVDDALGHRLVGGLHAVANAIFQRVAHVDDFADALVAAQDGVVANLVPVRIERDQARSVFWHIFVHQSADGLRQRLERTALLGEAHALEHVDVVGVNGEQPDVVVHALVHVTVETRERGEVVANLLLLVGRLLEQALRDHELQVLLRQQNLNEAIANAAQAVGDELEARAVENSFLHAGNEAEARVLANLADLAQERQVIDQVAAFARAQVFKEFVDDKQQALVWVLLRECVHHGFQGVFGIGDGVGCRELECDAVVGQERFQLVRDDVAQSHLARNLDAVDLELAGDLRGCGSHFGMTEMLDVFRVFGQQRDHRHQVRLTGAVVADDELGLVVGRLVKLKLVEDDRADAVGHLVGDDVVLDEAKRLVTLICKPQLNDRFDRIKADGVSVAHGFSVPVCSNCSDRRQRRSPAETLGSQRVQESRK